MNRTRALGAGFHETLGLRCVSAIVLLASAACSPSAALRVSDPNPNLAPVALPPDIERVLRDYERAWQAHNADALAQLFSDDGYVLSNNRPPVWGREAIRASYSGAGGALWLRALSFATEGDVGYIVGVYGHAENEPERGKFVLALRRRADGSWLIAADIDNGIAPARPAPTPPG